MKILLRCRACDVMELEEFRVDIRVCGQHIYKDIWHAVVGKVLVCDKEPNTFQDRYAVAVKNENCARLIFAHKVTHKNTLTAKITQTMVVIVRRVHIKALTIFAAICIIHVSSTNTYSIIHIQLLVSVMCVYFSITYHQMSAQFNNEHVTNGL